MKKVVQSSELVGSQVKKDKATKVAVLVINNGLDLKEWEKLNTAAHLGASLGAHVGNSLLMHSKILSKDGDSINLNIKHAIMLKKSNNSNDLFDLAKTAKTAGFEVEEFTREMISTTNDKKVLEQTLLKDSKEIERLGVLVFGTKDVVERMTEKFEKV